MLLPLAILLAANALPAPFIAGPGEEAPPPYRDIKPGNALFSATQTGPHDALILEAAADNGLDPWVLKGLLANESNLNPKMKSRTGVGIASVTPAGARGVNWIRAKRGDGHKPEVFTMRDAMDPVKAIPAVAEFVAWGVRSFGSLEAGLGFWNGGFDHARKIKRWGYRCAQQKGLLRWCAGIRMSGVYVDNVLKRANGFRALAGLPPLSPPGGACR
jgi:hypothetical protein